MNKRVCIYCRTAQNDQANLDSQIKQLTDFAKQKSLEIVKIISEFGSGLNLNRNGLNEITKLAESKQVDMILTRDVSRISRDTFHSLKFIENIRKYIEFKTVDAFDIPQDEWDNILSVLSKFCNTYK